MKDMHGIIFAYVSHPKLKELTERRTAASIPFGGRYRCIDFMLSNMVNAGINDVGVVMRESYQSLLDHLGSGKDWDLARKRGGLKILPPFGYAGPHRNVEFRGRMEALFGLADYISRIRQEYVVLADGEVVANLSLEEVLDAHIESGADITCLCTPESSEDCKEEAFYTLSDGGRISEITVGPNHGAPHSFETMNIFVMSKQLLENLLGYCVARNLYHFNRDVLQAMKEKLKLCAYIFNGYCARLTSVADYFHHSMQILDPVVRSKLFLRSRGIHTKIRDEAPTYYSPDSLGKNSLVADGCFIEGQVENSVLFRGVRVGKGAVVQNCVLMQDTVVRSGARLSYVITDKEVTINENHMLVGHSAYPIAVSKGASV
ncbi:MAG: glucose-1-phosphate adenylyltransferase subunit GlgD [Oscillospiraceae bacterium]|nr:glucose-1-phosphate adenylyltransferase subunit GlgD [Oscillospiraceae bacterium]